jgi:hypothetical protein
MWAAHHAARIAAHGRYFQMQTLPKVTAKMALDVLAN